MLGGDVRLELRWALRGRGWEHGYLRIFPSQKKTEPGEDDMA